VSFLLSDSRTLDFSVDQTSLDGYCSTVQGLLDWFEVDLGFTELLFIQIDMCVMCVFVLLLSDSRTLDFSADQTPLCIKNYGVATISKLLHIIGLFCNRAL